MELVFASNNPHKLAEMRRILGPKVTVLSLADIGCHDDIPETADTLQGNALIKARHVWDKYHRDCFADDTGLVVDALGGRPGVMSARYAGDHCSPADNVAKLLDELRDTPTGSRTARFITYIALIRGGEETLLRGAVEGEIMTRREGEGGFGYDPIFKPEESDRSFAAMDADSKNAISHRGRAAQALLEELHVEDIR